MTLQDTLDAAAEQAMRGRRLDAAAVLARLERDRTTRRARTVRTGAAAVLVAAAVLALLVALLPGLAGPFRHGTPSGTPSPSPYPVGLPDRLWNPPDWTPWVTDDPVPAASVLLANMYGTLFVVSADGRQYRRVADHANIFGRPVLSADGTQVAWVDQDTVAQPGATGPGMVHLLRLGASRVSDVRLPDSGFGMRVNALQWTPDGAALLVNGDLITQRPTDGSTPGTTALWRVDAARGTASLLCGACSVGVARSFGGVLLQDGDATAPLVWPSAVRGSVRIARGSPPALSAAGGSITVAVSPGGTQVAGWEPSSSSPPPTWVLSIDGFDRVGAVRLAIATPPTRLTVGTSTEFVDAAVLGWTARGILVRLTAGTAPGHQVSTIESVDPATGRRTRIATLPADPDGGYAIPVAVSAVAANAPSTVPGVEPSSPWWQPPRLRSELDRVFRSGAWLVVLMAVVVLALGWRRRARRRARR